MLQMIVLPNIKLILWLVVLLKSMQLTIKKYLYHQFVMIFFIYFLLLLPKIIGKSITSILLQHFQPKNQMRLFTFEFFSSSNTCLGIVFKFFKVFTDSNKLLICNIFYLKNSSNLLTLRLFFPILAFLLIAKSLLAD